MDAQEEMSFKDRVYLSHGSMLVGSITNYVPGESLTLKLKSGNELTFQDQQIRKIIMHKGSSEKTIRAINPLSDNKLFHEVQFAFLTNANGTGYALSYNLMYQKNQLIAFGAGFGMDNFYAAPGREIFPIYGNAKLNLTEGNSAPYLGMKLGYGLAFANEEQNITNADGGLMVNPYFGIRIGSKGMIVNLFTGIKFQKVDYELRNSWETRREDILHRRLEIGASIMF